MAPSERNSTFSLGYQREKTGSIPRWKEPWRANRDAGTSTFGGGARHFGIGPMSSKNQKYQRESDQECSLFIDGLKEDTSYNQLKSLFKCFESVARIFVQKEKKANRRWKFGFVRFKAKAEALKAMKTLQGRRLNGNVITISRARYPLRERWKKPSYQQAGV